MNDEQSEREKLLARLPEAHQRFVREQDALAPPQAEERMREHLALVVESRRRQAFARDGVVND